MTEAPYHFRATVGFIMEADSNGFFILIAFLVGAIVQKFSAPNGAQLQSMHTLLTAVARYLGAEHTKRVDQENRKEGEGNGL